MLTNPLLTENSSFRCKFCTLAEKEKYPPMLKYKRGSRFFQPRESPSRSLLCDCENFTDGSFAALAPCLGLALRLVAAAVTRTLD